MKEKNDKNVSLGAGLAPSSLLEGQEPAFPAGLMEPVWVRNPGDPELKSWGQNPEEPMPGRENDGLLPSLPLWRVLFMFWNCVFCHPCNVATCWRREALPTQGLTLLPIDRASSGHTG